MPTTSKMSTSNDSACGEWTADFQFYLFPITYSLVMVLGLLGNLGALFIFFCKTKQKSPSTVYVSSLALADTLFLIVLPFRIHYHLNGNDWEFGHTACRLTGTLFYGNIYISIAFMSCICVDRYIATVHPHTYLRLRNTHCATFVSVSIWTLGGTITLAFMLTSPLDMYTSLNRRSCFENFSEREWRTSLAPYSTFFLIFGALFPSLIILVLYPVVARRISRIRTSTARGALRIIYTILAITMLCFLPYHLVYLLHVLWRTQVISSCSIGDGIYKARRVTMALISMNSLFDPVLYYFATSHCKWTFKWPFKWTLKWLNPKSKKGIYTISGKLQAH